MYREGVLIKQVLVEKFHKSEKLADNECIVWNTNYLDSTEIWRFINWESKTVQLEGIFEFNYGMRE